MVICEGSNTMDISRTVLPNYDARERLDAGSFGTMGVGLGFAIAAAAVHPDRKVVCVEGDSAFGFSGMEVETACRYGMNITFVIVNNNGIGGGVDDFDRARAFAKTADEAIQRDEIWGPLHGVPMTLKESYDVAGLITTRGNPTLKDNRATVDALSVKRLKQLGVNIFGKTNVPFNLADMQSFNDIYGTTNNPWDTSRGPGGSSGGSAATLAAGMTGLDCGSDIGGSIRNPAHFCGVFGHKPTWGLLPPRGHSAPGVLAQSDLTVIGPLARSAADLEVATLAMAGPDEIQAAGLQLALKPCPHPTLAGFPPGKLARR